MCKTYLCQNEVKNSLNYLISLLFIGIEVQLQEKIEVLQFLSIALIIIAVIYRILYVQQSPSWKTDLSPIFLWLLTLARISSVNNFKNGQQTFVCYTLGFVNGQFNSAVNIESENSLIAKGKVGVQLIIFVAFLTIVCEEDELSIVVCEIILIIMIGVNELRYKAENNMVPKQEQQSNKLLNELSFQQIIKNQSKNSNDENLFVKHSRNYPLDSIEEDEQPLESKQKKQENNSQSQSLNWLTLIEQCEDYICRFTINVHQSDSQLQHSFNNYTFNKFLQDNQMTFLQFIKEMKVHNDLNLTQYDMSSSEFQKLQTLYDWLHFHLEQYKIVEQIQFKRSLKSLCGGDDQLQFSYPSNQKSLLMDLVVEKSIMGLSSIPYQQGSSEALNLKNNKINLFGRIKTQKSIFDLCIKLYVFEEECESGSQLNIVFMMKDIDKLVSSLKQNFKNIELLESATKFIQNQVCKISNIHRTIREAKIVENDFPSRVGTQAPRRTYSLGSNKDSIEEARSDTSEKIPLKKNTQLQLLIQKLQFDFIQVEQDNFNFFEVFTTNDKIWLEKKKIDISQLIINLFDLFQNDSLVTKYGIKLMLIDMNLFDRFIVTDTRRCKQLLINLINNSIKSYDFEQYLQSPNEIELTICNQYEELSFEFVDYGSGLVQADLNSSRLLDCKLGLAACQRLIYQLSNGKKQLTIQRTDQKTCIKFQLPRVLIPDKIQYTNEFDFENIQLVNS